MSEKIKVIKYYDDELEQFVTKEIYLSQNATCEICSKVLDKSTMSYYSYNFDKRIYTGCCFSCLPVIRARKIPTESISLTERIQLRCNIRKLFPKVKFKPIEVKLVKERDIQLFELTVDEAFKVSRGTDILVYNTLFDKSLIFEGGCSIKSFWKKISPVLHSEIKFFVFKREDVPVE